MRNRYYVRIFLSLSCFTRPKPLKMEREQQPAASVQTHVGVQLKIIQGFPMKREWGKRKREKSSRITKIPAKRRLT